MGKEYSLGWCEDKVIDYKSLINWSEWPKLIFVLLVLLIIGQWGFALKDWMAFHYYFYAPVSLSAKDTIKTGSTLKNPSHLALFGTYVPRNVKDSDIKESMLNLEIVGILFSMNEKGSQVILRMASGQQMTYQVGDKVPGGAVIKRITHDGVLFERLGTLERLNLPKDTLRMEKAPRAAFHH
jgi:general secretion pathway protein C